jgi:pimeloyl-ACP methyl ester carboxylesterase
MTRQNGLKLMDAESLERKASGPVAAARARVRRSARVAALAAAAALLAAAAVPADAPAAARGPATPRVPVLAWRSCDGGFQCATARVPLSYADPRGATISIAVIRHRATGPAPRLGTLFFNGGGPNEQIQGFVADFAEFPAALRERYDIVTFDPRGFGYSTQVRCFPTMAAENKFLAGLPPFPVGARQDAAWERTWARFDARCAARGGALIDHDTTADVARDMDLLREAVRDPVLDYYGESYGTLLGATYANLFPATVGHMILDGNLNPAAWTHPDGVLPSSLREGRDLAAAATLRDFLDLCGQTATPACAFSAGSPAATRAKWATLLRRLLRHPVAAGTPRQVYSYADAVTAVPLGRVAQWQQGAALLQQLWLASAGSGGGAARPGAPATAAAPAAPYSGQEQQLAVLCSDGPNPGDPGAYPAVARLASARSGAFGLEYTWDSEECAAWPAAAAQDRYSGPWNRRTAGTILLFGSTGDPATSYQSSVALSRELARARLLTIDGYGHTEASNPSTCAIGYGIRYLLTGALPPAGTVCPQNATPFPGGGRLSSPGRGEAAQQVPGEVAAVPALQLRQLPVAAADRAAAGRRAAVAGHRVVGVVEQRVVGGQLLPRGHVPHGDQHDVAGEPDVGLAGVVDEQHDRLVLGLVERHQVKAVGDLDVGVAQPLRQRVQGGRVDEVTALDRHDLAGGDRLHRDQAAALDPARPALGRLGRDVAGNQRYDVLGSGGSSPVAS